MDKTTIIHILSSHYFLNDLVESTANKILNLCYPNKLKEYTYDSFKYVPIFAPIPENYMVEKELWGYSKFELEEEWKNDPNRKIISFNIIAIFDGSYMGDISYYNLIFPIDYFKMSDSEIIEAESKNNRF